MASRRGRDQDRRQDALSLAGGRPARRRARRAGPASARQEGGQAPAAQAAEAPMPSPSGHDHRQAALLGGGKARDQAGGRPPPAQGPQQPGRELAPTAPPTRTADEALQVGPTGSTVPLRPRS